jgi:hypothetical protein
MRKTNDIFRLNSGSADRHIGFVSFDRFRDPSHFCLQFLKSLKRHLKFLLSRE